MQNTDAVEPEDTPLLPESQRDTLRTSENINPRLVVALVTAVVFITTFGACLTSVPILRVVEDILCRRILQGTLPAGDIDESLCKRNDIQQDLATFMGVQSMLEAVPGLFLALPYGMLADRVGRRPVLFLSLLGMVFGLGFMLFAMRLSDRFPPWTIWLSSGWQVIGGGSNVMIAMVYAMIADVQPPEGRADAFYLSVVGSILAELLAVPLSTKLMQTSPWIPLAAGLGFVVIGTICVAFLPETLKVSKIAHDGHDSNPKKSLALEARLRHAATELKDAMSLLKSYSIVALLITFLVHGLLARAGSFTIQYISKRFGWSLAQAGSLLVLRNIVNIILLLAILPACSRLLLSPRFPLRCSPEVKDLVLARASGILLVLGTILMAAPSLISVLTGLIIMTLGGGFTSLSRSIVTSLVDSQHTGRLYSLISICDACSALSAGPIIAWLFRWGIGLGGDWVGLPYLGVAFLCLLVTTAVFTVQGSSLERKVSESGAENGGIGVQES